MVPAVLVAPAMVALAMVVPAVPDGEALVTAVLATADLDMVAPATEVLDGLEIPAVLRR